MSTPSSSDPFAVLGLHHGASEDEVRARYLELVKQFPPERSPERFQEIRTAYESARDPLVIARQLVTPPDPDEPQPTWEATIEAQKRVPPKLTTAFLLSLGNRDSVAASE